MKRRSLGNSTLQVSEICLGTMTFGQQNSASEAHAQLDRAFAAGVNFIDTAEMYPVPPRAETCGRSEEIVGNWLATLPQRAMAKRASVLGLMARTGCEDRAAKLKCPTGRLYPQGHRLLSTAKPQDLIHRWTQVFRLKEEGRPIP